MKNLFVKSVLVLLGFSVILQASDIDTLLDQYKTESELSKKTKDENAGHLIVYTRDDLERMQVETLKDVLKSIRFFRYLENRVNEPDMINLDPVAFSSKSVRIYLNDNELVLPITGSGFNLFGNIEMDFVDHVEIYEGFPSFDFGIEPATVVIRLYSKEAKRDAGTRVKVLGALHGTHKENIYNAGFVDDMAYFVYANHSQNNQDSYDVDNQTVKRDTTTNHFYGSLEKENYKVELNAFTTDHDGFLGLLPYAAPKETNLEKKFINASFGSKFQNDSLTFNLSYINSSGSYDASYSSPVPGGFSLMNQQFDSEVMTAIVKKKFKIENHAISAGVQFRYKNFSLDDVKYDSVPSPAQQKYDTENIYSLFLEDAISFSENNLVSLSAMLQHYDRNKAMKDEDVSQVRLSYIYTNKQWVSKTFLSNQEFVPEPFMTAESHVGNPNLDPEEYLSLTQEISRTGEQTMSKIVFGYNRTKKFLIPDNLGVMQNSKDDFTAYYAALEFHYFFRKKDELQLAFDYAQLNLPNEATSVEHYNYLIRMVNSVSKFDIFNELVINHGFENLDTGYDYSAGVKYGVTPDLHINLKGENILNAGLTRKYYYNLMPTTKLLEVPVIEQKFMLSVEYLF
ncbi:TonB-dependent receptor plug domain-containing protein [Sulfurimonas paralvinellae]|uniref:TonB-dependent receptor plug domain-containing protein n=1 Tax=Sulfurimonas paralvinellae TaxID=317658 RepID=UPI001866AC75|nr:TonB-dependent receptor [Sulfurimonas paralvinellae]